MIKLNEDSLRQWQEEDLEHKRYEYEVLTGEKIIDIGSYQGEWSNEMIRRYGCNVELFEALENRAAWLFDGELEFGGAFYYSTQFADNKPYRYKCVDIAPFLQSEIAVCKINIEGGEYDLLNYIIFTGAIRNIRNLQVQFHEVDVIDWQEKYNTLATRLSMTHRLSWRYPFCWESWERVPDWVHRY